ncbi:MAG TPA: bifunctional methylenetetrahydrofolate dehydrogenase/methenyltetrahydrofolate cyclohydrolase FolD [Legionella sp.]|nr:bifunctional methylenetetrahydrofolate dehydrogenase/methenyltetrahydrofolate cyclohydrolase FolD [Legionella sp.]
MVASILDGKYVADKIRTQIRLDVDARVRQGHRAPGLAVILLGDDPASSIYVKSKRNACLDVGFHSFAHHLPMDTTESALLSLIDTLNEDIRVDGILVQLPLPTHINPFAIIERIHPDKDVDGFHPINLGRLAQGNPRLRPCTPYGVITLLNEYERPIAGQHAVVVGASNIVGRPMALEFLHAKATVTICHRMTRDLEHHVRRADILVVATGIYNVVPAQWLHKNQTVIDIGIHRRRDGTIHGDIDFSIAQKSVAWISPVPGGAGPMTICALLQNTLAAANYLST